MPSLARRTRTPTPPQKYLMEGYMEGPLDGEVRCSPSYSGCWSAATSGSQTSLPHCCRRAPPDPCPPLPNRKPPQPPPPESSPRGWLVAPLFISIKACTVTCEEEHKLDSVSPFWAWYVTGWLVPLEACIHDNRVKCIIASNSFQLSHLTVKICHSIDDHMVYRDTTSWTANM